MKLTTLLAESTAAELVNEAEALGEKLQLIEVKTHQIRNFYAAITKIRLDWRNMGGKGLSATSLLNKIILIKPQLAYAAARSKNQSLKPFYEYFAELVKVIEKELGENNQNTDAHKANVKIIYENFIAFMEAIVAYHKFYEKKGTH